MFPKLPAISTPSAVSMFNWLESHSIIRKIDNYMMNHPLWSPREEMQNNRKWNLNPQAPEYVPRAPAEQIRERLHVLRDLQDSSRISDPHNIQLRVAQRNKGDDLNFMIVSWIPNRHIAEWCIQENLIPNAHDAQCIEDRCKELISSTVLSEEYNKIKKGGVDILEKLSVDQRKPLERLYELYFKNALEGYFRQRGQTYNKDVVMTPAFIEEIMIEYLRSTNIADYENVIAYAKYRHTEFRHEFIVGCSSIRFTIFAYVLPENKPFHTCIYHKSSIIIKNGNFASGKYQTCRWNL